MKPSKKSEKIGSLIKKIKNHNGTPVNEKVEKIVSLLSTESKKIPDLPCTPGGMESTRLPNAIAAVVRGHLYAYAKEESPNIEVTIQLNQTPKELTKKINSLLGYVNLQGKLNEKEMIVKIERKVA